LAVSLRLSRGSAGCCCSADVCCCCWYCREVVDGTEEDSEDCAFGLEPVCVDEVDPSIPPRITASLAPSVDTVAFVIVVEVAIGNDEV
jgi:hypothetical protein